MNKFICKLSQNELRELYNRPNMTLKKMCEIVGCKSTITMSNILKENNISTNRNSKTAFTKRGNRTDQEFKDFLIEEYTNKKRSMTSISKELNISWVVISKYLEKYGIQKRSKSEQQSGVNSSNWKGGKRITTHGYIEVYCPNHPHASKRKTVYEHQLIAEQKIGRYLKPGEVVHHIDLNKHNNSPNNIIVLTNSQHTKLHDLLKKGFSPQEALKGVANIK